MPQLDAATYRSQVFWLSVFFIGYYVVSLNFFIPSLATRRKARSKKAALGKGQLSSWEGERRSALASYDGTLTSSASWVSGQLASSVVTGQVWREAATQEADGAALAPANQSYLVALAESRAQGRLAGRL